VQTFEPEPEGELLLPLVKKEVIVTGFASISGSKFEVDPTTLQAK
jgi:hypothetical protein